jgi:hypothetical protein
MNVKGRGTYCNQFVLKDETRLQFFMDPPPPYYLLILAEIVSVNVTTDLKLAVK